MPSAYLGYPGSYNVERRVLPIQLRIDSSRMPGPVTLEPSFDISGNDLSERDTNENLTIVLCRIRYIYYSLELASGARFSLIPCSSAIVPVRA